MLRPSDCKAPNSLGITASISCLQASSYWGQEPFVSLSYLITSFNWWVKDSAQLFSQVTVRSILPHTVATGNPNIPLGDVPFRCSSAIWEIKWAGSGGADRFISWKSPRKKYTRVSPIWYSPHPAALGTNPGTSASMADAEWNSPSVNARAPCPIAHCVESTFLPTSIAKWISRNGYLQKISFWISIWQNDRNLPSLRPGRYTWRLCRNNLRSAGHNLQNY